MCKKLNIGCGESYLDGYVNVDTSSMIKVDVRHDLNTFPYPFAENIFDEIRAHHILEHLDRPFQAMAELHRILKPGGLLYVKVPHFSRGFTHAEHCHGFDITFPSYFDPKFTRSGYFGVQFNLISMRLVWQAHQDLLSYYGYGPFACRALESANRVITFLANLNPHLCSRLWCFWVGGFAELQLDFKKPLSS